MSKSVVESEEEYKKRLLKCNKQQLITAVMMYRKIARDNGSAYYKLAEKVDRIKEVING